MDTLYTSDNIRIFEFIGNTGPYFAILDNNGNFIKVKYSELMDISSKVVRSAVDQLDAVNAAREKWERVFRASEAENTRLRIDGQRMMDERDEARAELVIANQSLKSPPDNPPML